MTDIEPIAELLESLSPTTASEWSLFRALFSYAESIRNGASALAMRGASLSWSGPVAIGQAGVEAFNFLSELPERSLRQFHGLIEALDIYQSIHGEPLLLGKMTENTQSLRELKQIRDLCLEDGLRSIY